MLRAIPAILAMFSSQWAGLSCLNTISSQTCHLRPCRDSGVRRQQRAAVKRRNQKRSRR